MKEISFLKQNADRWKAIEKEIAEPKIDPARLTEIFIQVTDDLSYANTNYNGSRTTEYINGLASKVHQLVYRNKREAGSRIITFFVRELPLEFASQMKSMTWSSLVFGLAILLGVVSQVYNTDFVRQVLGDYYVDATIERIKSGRPLGVYDESSEFYMFVRITLNNIRVSFIVYVFGMFTAFGTALFLVYNGIMLGCFFTMFYQHNFLAEALRVVWIHGAFEISAIVIAGAAGFTLGNSLLFPGTYKRMYALKVGARRSIMVIVGLIPFFIFAGFLESYVTRHTEMPVGLSWTIIITSFVIVIFYFLVYPLYLRRKSLVL